MISFRSQSQLLPDGGHVSWAPPAPGLGGGSTPISGFHSAVANPPDADGMHTGETVVSLVGTSGSCWVWQVQLEFPGRVACV